MYAFSNLENAYRKAARNKRYRNEVLRFSANLEENLLGIQHDLVHKVYKQGEYRTFVVTEPKRRTISALPFRDRVMHHALNNVLEPILDKRFYAHSYACRNGKGLHHASTTLTQWIRNLSFENQKLYALKCDISKYFKSVDHGTLKAALRRVVKDKDMLWLLDTIIDSSDGEKGIPIGNLSSQLFANFYLDALDTYIKHELKARHYIRYMDDFIILSNDIEYLRAAWQNIDTFLGDKLQLKLNPKTDIVCAKNGVDFCGYRHWYDHKKVRKYSVRKMRRTIRGYANGKITDERFDKIIQSWLGHISHADSFKLRNKVLQEVMDTLP